MSKRIPLAIAIALIFLFSALTVIVTVSVYLRSYTKTMLLFGEQTKQYEALSELAALVRENYDGKADPAAEQIYTAKGYIAGLGDENSFYLTKEEYDAYMAEQAGLAEGTGIEAQFDSISETLVVISVRRGSPAAQQNIGPGDRIVSVGKSTVTVENYPALLAVLSQNAEKQIQLGLNKAEDLPLPTAEAADPNAQTEPAPQAPVKTVLLSTGYQSSSVEYSIESAVGYIKLSGFYEQTASEFAAALTSLEESGVTRLVIDVRNLGSANYDAAAAVIDRIVPLATEGTGAIATARTSNGDAVKTFAADTESATFKLAVLVNDRTAGAAELLAVDLKDFSHAVLVGERTAGNAGYRQTFMLEDGSALVLSVAKIYPYISDCYDGEGLTPDVELVLPGFQKDALGSLLPADDAQFQAAVTALKEN